MRAHSIGDWAMERGEKVRADFVGDILPGEAGLAGVRGDKDFAGAQRADVLGETGIAGVREEQDVAGTEHDDDGEYAGEPERLGGNEGGVLELVD